MYNSFMDLRPTIMTGEKFMLEEEKEVTFIVIFSGTKPGCKVFIVCLIISKAFPLKIMFFVCRIL